MTVENFGIARIGHGVRFTGTIQAPRQVVVDGVVDGEVQTDLLIVAANGVLHGKTTAQSMHVAGVLLDAMTCHGLLHITSSGTVEGQLTYGEVAIEPGGRLLGSVQSTRA